MTVVTVETVVHAFRLPAFQDALKICTRYIEKWRFYQQIECGVCIAAIAQFQVRILFQLFRSRRNVLVHVLLCRHFEWKLLTVPFVNRGKPAHGLLHISCYRALLATVLRGRPRRFLVDRCSRHIHVFQPPHFLFVVGSQSGEDFPLSICTVRLLYDNGGRMIPYIDFLARTTEEVCWSCTCTTARIVSTTKFWLFVMTWFDVFAETKINNTSIE